MSAIGVIRLAPEKPTDVGPHSAPARARGAGLFEILVTLETFKVRSHGFCAPGVIADKICQVIPIGIGAADGDHRVVNCASTEGRGPWIEDASPLRVVLVDMFFRIGR